MLKTNKKQRNNQKINSQILMRKSIIQQTIFNTLIIQLLGRHLCNKRLTVLIIVISYLFCLSVLNRVEPTVFLAKPSNMTRVQEAAIAVHKLSSTLDLGLFITLQKNKVTAIVISTASSEMEQPTIEMISKAFR